MVTPKAATGLFPALFHYDGDQLVRLNSLRANFSGDVTCQQQDFPVREPPRAIDQRDALRVCLGLLQEARSESIAAETFAPCDWLRSVVPPGLAAADRGGMS
jgi:hypothetical protein